MDAMKIVEGFFFEAKANTPDVSYGGLGVSSGSSVLRQPTEELAALVSSGPLSSTLYHNHHQMTMPVQDPQRTHSGSNSSGSGRISPSSGSAVGGGAPTPAASAPPPPPTPTCSAPPPQQQQLSHAALLQQQPPHPHALVSAGPPNGIANHTGFNGLINYNAAMRADFMGTMGLHGASAGFRTSFGAPMNAMGRRYTCKLCNHGFDSKAELQFHTQTHMREAKPYKCLKCPKSFANSSYLSQHMRIHLGLKPFGPCGYCQRRFTQLSHLQQHLRTHTGEKPYKCKYPNCEKAFSQLSNLQSHSRSHQTDKPYKCNSCYKCFDQEQALLDHIPKHRDSKHLKIHICHYCGKSYTGAQYLAKHMTKHADRRDRDQKLREIAVGLDGTTPWSHDLCSVHGVPDSCADTAAAAAAAAAVNLPYAFPSSAHPMMSSVGGTPMSSAACTYTYGGGMGGASSAATDPATFSRLAGLAGLADRAPFGSQTGRPYFDYNSFKPHAAAAAHANFSAANYNASLIRLGDIQRYAGSVNSTAEQFSSMLGMNMMKRDSSYP